MQFANFSILNHKKGVGNMSKDLTKQDWKDIAIQLADSFRNVLPAVGELNPEVDNHWLMVNDLASKVLSEDMQGITKARAQLSFDDFGSLVDNLRRYGQLKSVCIIPGRVETQSFVKATKDGLSVALSTGELLDISFSEIVSVTWLSKYSVVTVNKSGLAPFKLKIIT